MWIPYQRDDECGPSRRLETFSIIFGNHMLPIIIDSKQKVFLYDFRVIEMSNYIIKSSDRRGNRQTYNIW